MPKNYRTYHYQSLPTRQLAHCLMEIYSDGSKGGVCTVVLTEAPDNPGQSITTASETIATSLIERNNLNPNTTRWIEHWPAEKNDGRLADEYSLVSYTWHNKVASNPSWQPLSVEEADAFMGIDPPFPNNPSKDEA